MRSLCTLFLLVGGCAVGQSDSGPAGGQTDTASATFPATDDASTGSSGSSTTDGSTSTATSTSTTGSTGDPAPSCTPKDNEPNDDFESAEAATNLSPCRSPDHATWSGTFEGVDVDVIAFAEAWTGCGSGEAQFTVETQSGELCAYFLCDEPGTDPTITCDVGMPAASPPDGWLGCCGATQLEARLDCANASTGDNSASVIVQTTGEGDCADYFVEYGAVRI